MSNEARPYRHYIIAKTLEDVSEWYEVVEASRIEDVASYIEHKEFDTNAPPSSVRFLESKNDEVFEFDVKRGNGPFDSFTLKFQKHRFNGEFVMTLTISGYCATRVYSIEPTTIKKIAPQ